MSSQNILIRVLSPKKHIKSVFKNIFKHPKKKQEIEQEISVNLQLNQQQSQKTQNMLECTMCNNNYKDCIVCKKENKIGLESNFAKFVSSIMDFKMGKSRTEIEMRENISGNKSISTQQPMSPPKIVNPESKIKVCRSSIKFVEKSSISPKMILSCINPSTITHQNIQCDGCNMFPLHGSRYKCNQCLDFDLCSQCFSKAAHSFHTFQCINKRKQSQRKQKLRLNKNIQQQFKKIRGGIMSMVCNIKNII